MVSRYDQGILDVGMTKEDRVELVKTHSFTRKHATGKAKIELHVLQVKILMLMRILPGKYLKRAFKPGGTRYELGGGRAEEG